MHPYRPADRAASHSTARLEAPKKWGDFKGCASTDPDVVVFECMGCRKLLARPEVDEDGHDWSTLDATVAQHKNAKADAEEGA